jgi:hypothetical protein
MESRKPNAESRYFSAVTANTLTRSLTGSVSVVAPGGTVKA